jgi:2'-5' RNA ligase
MYFIALVLPSALNEKVLHWKNFVHQRYDCKVGLKSPAHITLIPPFWMEEDKESELFQDISQLAETCPSFTIKTKNFSAFKPRTIFIDVEKNIALNSLKEIVNNFFKLNISYKINVDSRPFHPHITIATRDLLKKSFYEAWPVFEKEKFEEQWEANALSVLRHNKKNWDVVFTSQFVIGSKA